MHDNQSGTRQISQSWLDTLMAPLEAEQVKQQYKNWKIMGTLACPSSRQAVDQCIKASKAALDAALKKTRGLSQPAVV